MHLRKHKLSEKTTHKSPEAKVARERFNGTVKKISPCIKRCQIPTSENPKRPKPKKT
jgi:hypothetical protein